MVNAFSQNDMESNTLTCSTMKQQSQPFNTYDTCNIRAKYNKDLIWLVATLKNKYFDYLSGACGNRKLFKIHNILVN